MTPVRVIKSILSSLLSPRCICFLSEAFFPDERSLLSSLVPLPFQISNSQVNVCIGKNVRAPFEGIPCCSSTRPKPLQLLLGQQMHGSPPDIREQKTPHLPPAPRPTAQLHITESTEYTRMQTAESSINSTKNRFHCIFVDPV